MVGIFGKRGRRARVVTASARRRPASISESATSMVVNTSVMRPAATSAMDDAPERYGMCVNSTPVWRANAAPAMCPGVPMPPEPYSTRPGRLRAAAISSFTEWIGVDGWVTIT